jgi:hypothetical protein
MSDQPENDGPYQDAQSAEEIERQIMDSAFPKTSAEWWARGEIEKLRARIAELEAENEKLREAMRPISLWSFEAKDNTPAIKELDDDILRVRAALNGEKE